MRSCVFSIPVYCSLLLLRLQYWLLGLLHLQLPPLHLRRLFRQRLLLREEGVVVLIVNIVVRRLMWRHFASRRRISLAEVVVIVLHRVQVVLVVLVLEALSGVLLFLRHRRYSCCFVA